MSPFRKEGPPGATGSEPSIPVIPASSGEGEGKKGFTLVELSVVLFILSLIAVAAVPRFFSLLSEGDLDRFASRLTVYIEHARDEAVYKREGLLLNCDLEDATFWVTDLEGEKNRGVLMRSISAPEGVSVADIVMKGGEKVFEGDIQIPFYAGGKAANAFIHLRGKENEAVTLEIPSLARRVKRHEGYLENI